MILVTGSTGFVGRHLMPLLQAKEFPVRCFIQDSSEAEALGSMCQEKIIGDVLDEESLLFSMQGVQTVIHLAGIRSELLSNSFEAIHYLGTRHVVDAAKKAGVKHIIYFSAEGASLESKSKLFYAKKLAEDYLVHSSIKYTIFRPTIIFGPYDHFVSKWVKNLRRYPLIPVFGTGKNLLQPVDIQDVIRCIIMCIGTEERYDKIYSLGGPNRLKFFEIIDVIGNVIGKKRLKFYLPIGLVRTYASFMEFCTSRTPFGRDDLFRWMHDRVCDHTLIEEAFNIRLTPFEEGVKKYFGVKSRHNV